MEFQIGTNTTMVMLLDELKFLADEGKSIKDVIRMVREVEVFSGKKVAVPYVQEIEVRQGSLAWEVSIKTEGLGFRTKFSVVVKGKDTGKELEIVLEVDSLQALVETIEESMGEGIL